MIDRLDFAAPFVYSSKGVSPESVKSRQLRDGIKRGDTALILKIVAYIAGLVADGQFPGFFGSQVTLVPVPGHTPLAPGAISTTQRIARALSERGLGTEVSLFLTRTNPVQKSAFAAPPLRPRARDHFESMSVQS